MKSLSFPCIRIYTGVCCRICLIWTSIFLTSSMGDFEAERSLGTTDIVALNIFSGEKIFLHDLIYSIKCNKTILKLTTRNK